MARFVALPVWGEHNKGRVVYVNPEAVVTITPLGHEPPACAINGTGVYDGTAADIAGILGAELVGEKKTKKKKASPVKGDF